MARLSNEEWHKKTRQLGVLSFFKQALIGASLRENDSNKLLTALKATGANLDTFRWYLDLIRDNQILHGGYGMGVERIISWICKLPSIREAIPFPRTEDVLWP